MLSRFISSLVKIEQKINVGLRAKRDAIVLVVGFFFFKRLLVYP
jgi:hypothetical protein